MESVIVELLVVEDIDVHIAEVDDAVRDDTFKILLYKENNFVVDWEVGETALFKFDADVFWLQRESFDEDVAMSGRLSAAVRSWNTLT